MVVRVIDVHVKPDRADDFSAATIRNHHASLKEQGVLRFDVLLDNSKPGHFLLYEVYESEDAALSHKETSHYAEWKAAAESMMAKPRTSISCTPAAPLDRESW
ncbi:MAG: antibiotic biosynthesis monooxygenase [Spirochaetales bacterium]|jgi:(4S)-4-hydroxy-5-phosphonooxypentane-2,3-dione isomerase|nr:antibiotic biosynthesis monooxygenase [Spirochaetales bacterium]